VNLKKKKPKNTTNQLAGLVDVRFHKMSAIATRFLKQYFLPYAIKNIYEMDENFQLLFCSFVVV